MSVEDIGARAPLAQADAAGTRAPAGRGGPNGDLAQVAREFESMLVRQMLESGGNMPGNGTQQAMCLDAFAQGVADRGGLGLAAQIERALSASVNGDHRR